MEYPQFPPEFVFGAATAAYQIEGGWDADGKGLSTWDVFSHTPGKIRDGRTGDIACNTYLDFQTDIDLMAALGLNAYRFSTAWSRVLPQGKGQANPKGLDYYKRLVDALLEKSITPFITLFHWDMPQALEDACGGFIERDGASYYADYAELVVKNLGDRVKHWITLNEPWEHAMFGHFLGEHAPGKHNPWMYFRAAHHQLLGHGLAVERIKALYPDCLVGITLSQFPVSPVRDTPGDRQAAEFTDLFMNRFFLDGLYRGRYPDGLWRRLWLFKPPVRLEDMQIISRPFDFLGVNYYNRVFARQVWYLPFFRSWVDREAPAGDEFIEDPYLGSSAFPSGLCELAARYRLEYGNPAVYITENGAVAEDVLEGDRVHDAYRQHYLQAYLSKLSQAIAAGSDIRGYFVWTMVDNFEWSSGYDCRMGIVYVDHATQRRVVKDSAYWYRDLIRSQRPGQENKTLVSTQAL